ncbi:hypothetical protein BHE74_00025730 [Ensete ventricosum]|nr:hypothetical protein GW17_00024020 [Ensete ventricosum]RWW66866.1 hypothetical protein BHE74_00025730 [Ensete ventricosum]
MVPKTKRASRHIHLVSNMHLTEELRRFNLRRRSWDPKALARGKRTQRRVLLKNMPQCCHSDCHEESGDLIIQTYDRSSWRVGLLQCSHSLKGSQQVREQGRVVQRGEDVTTSPEGLSYPKSKASVRKEVDSEECHSAAEADLPIAKKETQMQSNG